MYNCVLASHSGRVYMTNDKVHILKLRHLGHMWGFSYLILRTTRLRIRHKTFQPSNQYPPKAYWDHLFRLREPLNTPYGPQKLVKIIFLASSDLAAMILAQMLTSPTGCFKISHKYYEVHCPVRESYQAKISPSKCHVKTQKMRQRCYNIKHTN